MENRKKDITPWIITSKIPLEKKYIKFPLMVDSLVKMRWNSQYKRVHIFCSERGSGDFCRDRGRA